MHRTSEFRLLVVRLGAMGDILHALPAVTALRIAHPEWRIDWVVDPRWRALLEAGSRGLEIGNREKGTENREEEGVGARDLGAGARDEGQPLVDGIHFAPAKEWGRRPVASRTLREIRGLRRALRASGYDAALDLQGAVRSAMIARLAGCGRVIGEAEPREGAARWLFNERVRTHGAHVIEQDVELASALAGDKLEPVKPLLPMDGEAELWCGKVLTGKLPVVVMNPGAGWGAKRWPVERYAMVARGLVDRGIEVVVNTGPGEEPLAQVIVQETKGAARLLMPSLGRLIELMRRVALCISGDSGPLHLACALGRPVVGIYGPTDPTRNGPFGTRARVLRSPASRRDHSRKSEPEAGLLTIQPEEVLRAAEELLVGETA
ncbi:MAG TPA: glycosyltransferase family 9 protein [Terracidiphilus sp.]|nr:glycosyltransferase family 9 protein [Terracidiphilus sp.]